MPPSPVSIVRYDQPLEPVRAAIDLAGGLERVAPSAKVFIKPNIVFWTSKVNFPKWGVITTSRLVHDVVRLLAERGVSDITIGEGMVLGNPKEHQTSAHAFEHLGYKLLAQRFGGRVVDTFQRPFRSVDLGGGITLNFNQDALESDLVIDLPVMKTHAQSVVSLGIKNLKGLLDVKSRKVCHSADPVKDLHYHVARLAQPMQSVLTLIDGTFTSEYGPAFDGIIHRRDLLVASWDILAADMVGAALLGLAPEQVPHLVHAAANQGRGLDLNELDIKGERIADHARPHQWSFPYNPEGTMPIALQKMGISGLSYHKYDSSLCTYCSALNGAVLTAVAKAWKGEAWDGVEVLTGKKMRPSPEANHTILLGKCMYQAHKDNPNIKHMIAVKGCPPQPEKVIAALHQAGIAVEERILANMDSLPGMYMKRYAGKPGFDESLFTIS